MVKALEHGEHAQHAAEHGNKLAALVVAILAAFLAVSEQQAKLAEIKVANNAVLAADSWNQYQGKSTRQLVSSDLASVVDTMDKPADPALAEARAKVAARLHEDVKRFQEDPKDGKEAIARRAGEFEHIRDVSLERAHAFDKAAASLELGIVLATASAITSSKMLIRFAIALGSFGVLLAVLGLTDPELVPF